VGRESLAFRPAFSGAAGAPCQELGDGQFLRDKSIGFVGGIAGDPLVFEFMGLGTPATTDGSHFQPSVSDGLGHHQARPAA